MTVDWVAVTLHASQRWRESRSTDAKVGPRGAWIEGQEIPVPDCLDGDEVRYHSDSDCVLIRKGPSLVTVISLSRASKDLKSAVTNAEVVEGGS